MNDRFGVDAYVLRSPASRVNGTTPAAQRPALSMIEWKYTNGSCRVAYWSVAVSSWVLSADPIAGWPQVADSQLLISQDALSGRVPASVRSSCQHFGRRRAAFLA